MTSNTEKWSEAFLLAKRQETDPAADKVVRYIIDNHEQAHLRGTWKSLRAQGEMKYDELPPIVANYFKENAKLPQWADPKKIELGQKVFADHGLAMSLLLQAKALPQSYACAKGAKVLASTGRLMPEDGLSPFTRRLMETAQFVMNVMEPGSLDSEGKGMISALKVRLMHASIRYYLQKGNWDFDKYDHPINQEDMTGTMLAFSALTLEGMELLNVTLSREEQDAYVHVWNCVGHIMGVQDDMIPSNYAEGKVLGKKIFDQQIEGSDDGKILTDACIEFMQERLPKVFHEAPYALIHYLVGDKAAQAVGVSADHSLVSRITETFIKHFFKHTDKAHSHSSMWSQFIDHIKIGYMERTIHAYNKHRPINFDIPPSLHTSWKLNVQRS
jgi:hypothetical protein